MSVVLLLSRSFLSAALLTTMASAAVAQVSITRAAEVYPLVQQGQLTGCQVSFSVLRSDEEYNGGRPALVNGLILFQLEGRVGLRIGVANDARFERFIAPDRAYFFGSYKSNVMDYVDKFESSEQGFRVFLFGLGEATTDLLLGLLDTGRIEIMYAPAGGAVDARFVFDLASFEQPYSDYMECMATLFEQPE